jgi:hypothetical protein
MKQRFIELLKKTDWRDLRACMCCREVCEFCIESDVDNCSTCPVCYPENFKQLLREFTDETTL